MRTTSLRTIYITENELKKSIIAFLIDNGNKQLASHLANNVCSMDWNSGSREFAISIDGEIKDVLKTGETKATNKDKNESFSR